MNSTIDETSPEWNLGDLYGTPDDRRFASDIAHVAESATAFAARYRGKIEGLAPVELREALAATESIQQSAAKPQHFTSLRFAAATTPENGAAFQQTREATTAATLPMVFFDVELSALGTNRLDELAAAPELAPYCHYLQTVAAHAAHKLTEAEERLQEELANTGRRAFVRLFQEIVSGLRCTIPGRDEPISLTEAIGLQSSPDRAIRAASAHAITTVLQKEERTLAFLFNTLIQEKAVQDRLRGYAYPEEARHQSNELAPTTVETVVDVVTGGYGMVARFYETKRRLLDLPTLAHYDRYAPLPSAAADTQPIAYGEARDLVLRAFAHFDADDYAATAARFFDGDWIDARVRPGKRGGAFCDYVTPDLHPYLLVNYLGRPGDVRTLAHELGHGIHSYLSRGQTYFNYHGTLPMAEVASTFAEKLVSEEQNRDANDDARLEALAREIDQAIGTIFRQTALYQFERAIHAHRRDRGELTAAQFGELWQESVGAMFAGSVTLEPGHTPWWSYVSHFIASPFYVYAYSFGEMLALALYRQYQIQGDAFVPLYLDMLRAGGSLSPADLTAPLGIDLEDRAFWEGALEVFEAEVTEFERLARIVAPEKFSD